ncbi:hypothetical protein AGABI1DRAFT_115585 [Agaricus bisporus var. burnettii JB137-S8]|uniref:Uncharacterized protein n=1 Tax=Agaricus bisporus var. burnettii (strain JB137-S8 / ATCC MYA-4627 / FGSC 10392) TaxID=597362 RepID=K5XQ97_AGABU|nr:uncharacterized protein AGABI1DRAFT_115585 [Agaricus bisporus var. burnettii JB137-S8]EKM76955.1 hypothetical protein AGABI1DRAFT_115585 [Agaricus bisporus var. burnettii JB137-S8]
MDLEELVNCTVQPVIRGWGLMIMTKDWVDFTMNHFLTPCIIPRLAALQTLLYLPHEIL